MEKKYPYNCNLMRNEATHRFFAPQIDAWQYWAANGKIELSEATGVPVKYIEVRNGDKWENSDAN